jgi:diguanylate cyclase
MRAPCRSWSKSTCARHSTPGVTYGMESKDTKLLRDLLSRTLAFALASLLPASPHAVGRSRVARRRREGRAWRAALQEIARA